MAFTAMMFHECQGLGIDEWLNRLDEGLSHNVGDLIPVPTLRERQHGLADFGESLFVGTVAWTFTLINLTKLPIYFLVGLINWKVVLFDLVLTPLVPLGSWLGHWMHHRVPERAFNYVIAALTFVAGIQLLFNIQPIQWLLEHTAR